MMKFAAEMCDIRRREGRYFIFEQPQGSRAWDLGAVKEMMTNRDAWTTTMHQCMFGLRTRDVQGEALAYKPTTIVTNNEALAETLSRRCTGCHRHAQLVGKIACTKAAHHPKDMCEAVLKAVAVSK